MSTFHRPVLLEKVLDLLKPGPSKLYIDATAGGGGHTSGILEAGARVLAIDRDPQAIEYINKNYKKLKNLTLVNGNFAKIAEIAKANDFEKVSGILFDLGVSSHQLDTPARGFSFKKSGPLDMRMDPSITLTAKDIINNFDQRRLNEIFQNYSQEKFSWPIAGAICSARAIKPIEKTDDLAKIIKAVYQKRGVKQKIDPATKVFQALRIVVNSELLNLEEALPQTIDLLETGGTLAVISFHSLEDAHVKRFFKQNAKLKILTKMPIYPASSEIEANPRARSARLRAAEKI